MSFEMVLMTYESSTNGVCADERDMRTASVTTTHKADRMAERLSHNVSQSQNMVESAECVAALRFRMSSSLDSTSECPAARRPRRNGSRLQQNGCFIVWICSNDS